MYGVMLNGMVYSERQKNIDDATLLAERLLIEDESVKVAVVFKAIKTMRKVTTILTEGE